MRLRMTIFFFIKILPKKRSNVYLHKIILNMVLFIMKNNIFLNSWSRQNGNILHICETFAIRM